MYIEKVNLDLLLWCMWFSRQWVWRHDAV